jgi:glycosyltransferase involved in cell wall biosynthesis
MEKLKFCFLNNWFPPDNYAGSGIYVYRLANALAEEDHDVTVVYDRDAFRFKSAGRSQPSMPCHRNVRVIALETGSGKWAPVLTHQTGRPIFKNQLIKDIFREPYDVIHFNNVSLMGAPVLYRYGKGLKIATLHDYWMLCPISTLFKYGLKICRRKNCFLCTLVCKRPPQLWRYSSLLHREVEHIAAFLSPSLFLKQIHEDQGFTRPIIHLPNLVELSEGHSKEKYDQRNTFFLFSGRLESVKGVQEIIPSFRNGAFGRLVIAGDGAYRRELERLAAGSPYIEFMGYLDQGTLRGLYRKALATIVPSVWYDNQPTVVLESFSQGVPVVALDLAGHGELTRLSRGGLLYSDPAELRVALQQLRKNPSLRERLGSAGRNYFLTTHTREVHLKNYLSIISHLLNGHKPSEWKPIFEA